MGESEHYCTGCKHSHLAGLWYTRKTLTGKTRGKVRYLCGTAHAARPPDKKGGWRLPGE